MKPQALKLLIGLAALAVLAGCASKFNRKNFNLIEPGISDKDDVRRTLGDPTTTGLGDEWIYDDLDEHHTAIIYFDPQGRVTNKEWMDSVTGEWEGQSPHTNPPPEGEVRSRETRTRRIDD